MKLRKDDGSELKKGEYQIDCGDKMFVLRAYEDELQMWVEYEVERIRPYTDQNIKQEIALHLLKRRLNKLGIPEDEHFWAKDEEHKLPSVSIQHFDKTCPKEFVEETKKDLRKALGEDALVYIKPD